MASSCARGVYLDIRENFISEWAAQGRGGAPVAEGFQSPGDVAVAVLGMLGLHGLGGIFQGKLFPSGPLQSKDTQPGLAPTGAWGDTQGNYPWENPMFSSPS